MSVSWGVGRSVLLVRMAARLLCFACLLWIGQESPQLWLLGRDGRVDGGTCYTLRVGVPLACADVRECAGLTWFVFHRTRTSEAPRVGVLWSFLCGVPFLRGGGFAWWCGCSILSSECFWDLGTARGGLRDERGS